MNNHRIEGVINRILWECENRKANSDEIKSIVEPLLLQPFRPTPDPYELSEINKHSRAPNFPHETSA